MGRNKWRAFCCLGWIGYSMWADKVRLGCVLRSRAPVHGGGQRSVVSMAGARKALFTPSLFAMPDLEARTQGQKNSAVSLC